MSCGDPVGLGGTLGLPGRRTSAPWGTVGASRGGDPITLLICLSRPKDQLFACRCLLRLFACISIGQAGVT